MVKVACQCPDKFEQVIKAEKKKQAGKSFILLLFFFQELMLVLVLPGLNQGAVLTAAKLLEATLEVAYTCQFAVAVPYS